MQTQIKINNFLINFLKSTKYNFNKKSLYKGNQIINFYLQTFK